MQDMLLTGVILKRVRRTSPPSMQHIARDLWNQSPGIVLNRLLQSLFCFHGMDFMGYIASLNSVEPLLMAVNQPAPKLSGIKTKECNGGALLALSSKILCQSKGTVGSRLTEQSCLHL